MLESSNNITHVLVVDDHDELVILTATVLRLMGYVVRGAGSVAEARAALQDGCVDLVLIDWDLPDGTGADVCCIAREVRSDTKIVVFSGFQETRRDEMARCKPDAFFGKPMDMTEFKASIRQLLEPNLGEAFA